MAVLKRPPSVYPASIGESMMKRLLLILLVLLAAGVAAGYLLGDKPIAQSAHKETSARAASVFNQMETPAGKTPGPSGTPSFAAVSDNKENKDADKESIGKMFHADERGNLVLDKSARMNIEHLYALNTPEELHAKLQYLSTVLPSTAHRQLVNLLDYFDKYIRDVKLNCSSETAPATVEEELEQLQVIHSLRVKHFGSDAAAALFAEDEKTNRQLLELMLLDRDENATLQEKAERAQKALQLMKSKSGI